MGSSRYLVIKRGNRSIHTIRLGRRNRLLVDEGEAMSRGLYRRDKGYRRGSGKSGIRVEGGVVDYIHEVCDHRHHLLVPRRAVCQHNIPRRLVGPTSWGIWLDPQKLDHPSFFRMGSLSAIGSLSLSAWKKHKMRPSAHYHQLSIEENSPMRARNPQLGNHHLPRISTHRQVLLSRPASLLAIS